MDGYAVQARQYLLLRPYPQTGVSPKQVRFVEEYLVDLNATQAAVRAGYSQKTARSVGSENLTKPDIAQAIATAQAKRSERVGITADLILQGLWENVGLARKAEDFTASNKALELCQKHVGVTDKIEYSGSLNLTTEQREQRVALLLESARKRQEPAPKTLNKSQQMSTKVTARNIHSRLERLEEKAPEAGSLVVVRYAIVRPGPNGPEETGEKFGEIVTSTGLETPEGKTARAELVAEGYEVREGYGCQ